MFRFVSKSCAERIGKFCAYLFHLNALLLIRLSRPQHKTKDIVTLFHKASSPASVRVANLLKQASANATEHATEDQASDHSAQTTPHRAEFELNITEDAPTPDQLQTILQYVGQPAIPSVVKGASNESEALKIFKQSAEAFQRPVVRPTQRAYLSLLWGAQLTTRQTVDWNNGKAIAGADESKILKVLDQIPKK